MTMALRGLGVANPPLYITQEEACAFITERFTLKPAERDLYRRILLDGRIRGRFLGMADKAESLDTDPDRLLARFLKYGRACGAEAARRALAEAGVAPGAVAGLVVNTCTGYLCPGLSSYLAEDLGLPASIRHLDLMGMGCGAALPNLEAACGLLARGAEGPVLSVAVEICSATIFPAHEPDLVVSNCIFGDGAAAAVVERAGAGRAPALAILREYEGVLQPDHREDLRYRTQGGLLRNSLSRRVPVIGATAAKEAAGRLLARQGLSRENIAWWAVHPGGTVVLDQVEKALDLEAGALRFSRQVFEEYGNMSSPSVLFVLRKMLDSGELKPGDQGMLLAFGAGFSAFALQVEF